VAYSSTRSKDWEDVLTAHTGETFARTWSVREKKLGKWSMGGAEKAKGVSAKGKGVDVSLGAIKVGLDSGCCFFVVSNGFDRLFVCLHVEILDSLALRKESSKPITCRAG
jgi:U3 small nucleolar RNA-associated protein 21